MALRETLEEAIAARNAEIENYEINIRNYEIAIQQIADEHLGTDELDEAMREFSARLRSMLATSKVEQRKAELIRSALQVQLASLPAGGS